MRLLAASTIALVGTVIAEGCRRVEPVLAPGGPEARLAIGGFAGDDLQALTHYLEGLK